MGWYEDTSVKEVGEVGEKKKTNPEKELSPDQVLAQAAAKEFDEMAKQKGFI